MSSDPPALLDALRLVTFLGGVGIRAAGSLICGSSNRYSTKFGCKMPQDGRR